MLSDNPLHCAVIYAALHEKRKIPYLRHPKSEKYATRKGADDIQR